jgi:hypothetical protein
MTLHLNRRELLVAAGVSLLGVSTHAYPVLGQPASLEAVPELPAATDDGVNVPVLSMAFSTEKIVVTPEVPAGIVRLLTSVPYDDLGSVTFRIPDDQPDAIEQVLGAIMEPEPVAPDWFSRTHFPGGVRGDFRLGGAAEGFISLMPGTYAVIDLATRQSATFVATDLSAGAIDAKDVPYVGASFGFSPAYSPATHATVDVVATDRMTYDGLDLGVAAGRQLWQFRNGGEMTHNIYIMGTTEVVTANDILDAIVNDDESAAGGSAVGVLGTQALSPGAVQYFYLDLDAGPHAAMCTETADWQLPPHFFMGMIVTFASA